MCNVDQLNLWQFEEYIKQVKYDVASEYIMLDRVYFTNVQTIYII